MAQSVATWIKSQVSNNLLTLIVMVVSGIVAVTAARGEFNSMAAEVKRMAAVVGEYDPKVTDKRLCKLEELNVPEIRFRQDQVLKILDKLAAALEKNDLDHTAIKETLAELRTEVKNLRK